MKYLRTYEELTWSWYATIIDDKDVEFYYNKLKDSGILYRFYKMKTKYRDESIVFKYIKSNEYAPLPVPTSAIHSFGKGWIVQKSDFFKEDGKKPYDPEEFIKEYNFRMNIKKYNL